MPAKLPIALVRQGTVYPGKYVDLLRSQVPGATFVLLSDQPDYLDVPITVPLQAGLPGWWSKMELFAPWFQPYRPCLYLDLDTYVVGDISDILSFRPMDFWMLRDYIRPNGGQSAVMLIPEDTGTIWDAFSAGSKRIMAQYRRPPRVGDQAFLEQFPFHRLQDQFDGLTSYRLHEMNKNVPDGRVISFHGHPKPHECNGWAGEVWQSFRN